MLTNESSSLDVVLLSHITAHCFLSVLDLHSHPNSKLLPLRELLGADFDQHVVLGVASQATDKELSIRVHGWSRRTIVRGDRV